MATTEQYLLSKGVSMKQALDFVMGNLNSPQTIFDVAKANGVTTSMLADIVHSVVPTATADLVKQFFSSTGLDGSLLDSTGATSGGQSVIDLRSVSNDNAVIPTHTFDAGSGAFKFVLDMAQSHPNSLGLGSITLDVINNFGADDSIEIVNQNSASVYSPVNSKNVQITAIDYQYSSEQVTLVGVNPTMSFLYGADDFNKLPVGDVVFG